MSADLLPSPDLIDFQLFDWLRVDDREMLTAVFDTARRLAVDAFLPHFRKADVTEPWIEGGEVHVLPEVGAALGRYAELGLFGASFAEDLGGLGLPFTAALTIYASFAAANASTAGYTLLTIANARLISTFGTAEQIERFAIPQIAGRWLGTMCLSEPQAGSSLGDIRTRAVREGADALGERYRLTGNKMWISCGDHDVGGNIVHLVLAKIALADGTLPPGTAGISLFIVPKRLADGSRNDITVAGLNHKLGYRGVSNCLLNFGERDGAIGWRVGEAGQGLAQMFTMMNEARISVGMGAAAIAYRGYRHALRYARERRQGRAIGVKDGEPVAIIDHPDVRRMLVQQKSYAEGAIALCLYCARLVDEGGTEAEALLALLTPVVKSWPSEFGAIANDLAVQVHGGYGYTRDFDVEQLWRDNRLNQIHEGTTGIQAIDLLGRKILLGDGSAMELLRARIGETARRAEQMDGFADSAAPLLDFWRAVDGTIDRLDRRSPQVFDDATLFLRAFGHGVVAWLWLDQAMAGATTGSTGLRDGRAQTCRFFFEAELPQATAWLSIVARCSTLVRSFPDAAFA